LLLGKVLASMKRYDVSDGSVAARIGHPRNNVDFGCLTGSYTGRKWLARTAEEVKTA